jgi:signal transduction histidine kinase
LVEVFCSKLSVAFDNVILYEQLQQANLHLEQRVVERTRELTVANRRLAAQWERLRRANAFKSEILGKVAHDLKNPLGVITGRTEMMADFLEAVPVSADKVRSQVQHIRQSAERLIGMVDTLLADAMADALNISIRRESIDVAALVKEVVEASRPLLDRKQQRIDVEALESLTVSGDPDRLREAIDNLVSNANKYSPIGGRIRMSVARSGDDTVIRVSDNGPGLSPEDMSRLFGRFQRLSAKPTAGESSTGLGLSIVKRIVELHGGQITAESLGPGAGTTFTIALPSETEPA